MYGSGTVTDDLTFHKHGGPKCTSQDQLRDACCHLANMIEDVDKISFAYDTSTTLWAKRCRLLPNYFVPRLLTYI